MLLKIVEYQVKIVSQVYWRDSVLFVFLLKVFYNFFIIILKFNFFRIPFPPEAPSIETKWFGSGERPTTSEDASVRPFKISVGDDVINDLKSRLKLDLARLKTQHQARLAM